MGGFEGKTPRICYICFLIIQKHHFMEQIYIITDANHYPQKALDLAIQLANTHEKGACFLYIPGKNKLDREYQLTQWCNQNAPLFKEGITHCTLEAGDDFTDFMERNEAAAVIFELSPESNYNHPKKPLQLCRELRIPYYFVKPDQQISLERVLVPIGFLVEEREKGVFCSGMGRHFQSELLLMTANDYGSRAKENTSSIQSLLDKFQLNYRQVPAKKDSFKIELEAMEQSEALKATLLLISASRDYGMDDILFGPKEQKVIKKSTIPVMVLNPRKDLYALCS